MGKLDGHCLCGNVTYACDEGVDPAFVAVCHCADCQRQTGTAFSVVVGVPSDTFHVTGDTLASVTTVGELHGKDSVRNFCSACGSPIYTDSGGLPGVAIIKAGTLDDTSWLEPQFEVWGRSAQPWVEAVEGRPRVETMP